MIKNFHSVLFISNNLNETEAFYQSLGFATKRDEKAIRTEMSGIRIVFMDGDKVDIAKDVDINPKGAGIYLYFEVENVDDYYRNLVNIGLKLSSQPTDWPWGKREFAIKDPDGYKLVFFNQIESKMEG